MVTPAEQKFGVISDFLGEREDTPTLKMPKVFLPSSSGTFLQYGLVRTMPGCNTGAFVDAGNVKVRTPDGNPVIHHHRYTTADGTEYVFQFTKAHVYLWNEAGKSYTTMFTCTSDSTLWSSTALQGKLVSANGVDFIQVWDETTPATVFAALDTATGLDTDGASGRVSTAKFVGTAEGYLLVGATTEGGTFFPRRQRWSTGNDLADFDLAGSGDTGVKDFSDGSDVIVGFANYTFGRARLFVTFKERSIWIQWLVEGLSIWNWQRTEGDVGLLGGHASVNDQDGNLYYVASDFTVRKFDQGIISFAKARTLRAMNVSLVGNIEAVFMPSYNQLWWSIPKDAGSTENDAILAYNIEYGVWHQYPYSIRSFGRWSQQTTYTIDGLDALSDSIDGLDAQLPSIDFLEGTVGFPLDLASDYDGYTYVAHSSETDKGNAVTRNFVISVDLSDKRSLNWFKRVASSKAYFAARSTAGTLTYGAKLDNAKSFTNLGTLSLQAPNHDFIDVDLSFDIRAKHFLYKVEGTILFDFVGQFWTFEFDGDR